ncbi:hypothetical protein [Nonomuraea sp. bgisy101]|uniref:hypothetical protein n=1 Tax=Nonomuraea sp. bgisy101 TaxID=3413784 RepID=UPI003D7300CA
MRRRPARRHRRRTLGIALVAGAAVLALYGCTNSPPRASLPPAQAQGADESAAAVVPSRDRACSGHAVRAFLGGLDTHMQYGSADLTDEAITWWSGLAGYSAPPPVNKRITAATAALDVLIDASTSSARSRALPSVVRAAKSLARECGLEADYDFYQPTKKRDRKTAKTPDQQNDRRENDDSNWPRRGKKYRWF